jgi:hypothetical protein
VVDYLITGKNDRYGRNGISIISVGVAVGSSVGVAVGTNGVSVALTLLVQSSVPSGCTSQHSTLPSSCGVHVVAAPCASAEQIMASSSATDATNQAMCCLVVFG